MIGFVAALAALLYCFVWLRPPELAGVALLGMGLGLGVLTAAGVQRKRSLRSAAGVSR